MPDLLTKLSTFAVAEGWTEDDYDPSVTHNLQIHKNSVYVQFKWDTTTGNVAVFHSLGYTGGNVAGAQDDDSGNGDNTVPVSTERMISGIGNGPYEAYHFFSNDDNLHMALEFLPGRYRHFSCGMLVKVGDWTGGEYCAAHHWLATASDSLTDSRHSLLFDGRNTQDPQFGATIHVEDLPEQDPASLWGVVSGANTNAPGDDSDARPRVNLIGGLREGFWQNSMGPLEANPANGFIPMFPITVHQRKIAVPEVWRLLGYLPEIKFINISMMAPGQEFTLDGDTWKVFPWVRKNELQVGQEGSGNMGVAFLKVP